MYFVNPFVFIWRMICYLSFRKAVEYFLNIDEFYTTFGLFRLYGLKDRTSIRSVFGSNPNTSYLNRNFSAAHGMQNTIDTVDPNDPHWGLIHSAVKSAIADLSDDPIQNLCFTFEERVRASFTKQIDILQFTDELMQDWFFATFISKSVDPDLKERFFKIRQNLLRSLRFSFYGNRFRWIPIIGAWISKLFRRFSGIDRVRQEFKEFLLILPGESTFVSRYLFHTMKRAEEYFPTSEGYTLNDQIQIGYESFYNNALLMILVYDFMHMMILGSVIQKCQNAQTRRNSQLTPDDVEKIYQDNFLFPFRGRITNKDVAIDEHTIPSNSLILSDLLHSRYFYSVGKRSCAGQSLARPLIKKFIEILNQTEFIVVHKYVTRSNDPDIPLVDYSTSNIKGYIYFRDSLKTSKLIPNHDGLHNLWHLYSNPDLFRMIRAWVEQFTRTIPLTDRRKTTVIAPEARALPFATMFDFPIVTITKDDKFGSAKSIDYTRGYNSDVKSIHLYTTLRSDINQNVILVDDGIASGGTLNAAINLFKYSDEGDELDIDISIVSIINHTYIKHEDSLSKFDMVTMFDF